ncbi:MAG: rRNA (guanine-N1)-methyltransferase [Shewanella sp.]|nr:rRNA (guanine-N1)-methyltransferase [Shewanella sp.]MCF1430969.1 rRNA (guanine-N1)-methyltransferase [Shewanella sp.]
MFFRRYLAGGMIASACFVGGSFADDTELYVMESSPRTGARPQVLIIFDNSGSMGTREYVEDFYPRNDNITSSTKLYYTYSSEAMPKVGDSRSFVQSINGCASSKKYLEDYGMFTGFIREYTFSGQSGAWRELPTNSQPVGIALDCFEDIDNRNFRNAESQVSGLPVDGLGSVVEPVSYTEVDRSSTQHEVDTAVEKALRTGFGTGRPVTVYTENYINWYHGAKNSSRKTRLSIAKRVMQDTVVTTPGVDFGLAIFNLNWPSEGNRDGGRIIAGIRDMDEDNRQTLLSTINSLPAETNTPLCETLYEVYRYYSGQSVLYGNADSSVDDWYTANRPAKDESIINDGVYESPFKPCLNRAYVVLITDGQPTVDSHANTEVKNLPGANQDAVQNNYLASLSGWMNTHDVNPNVTDEQNVSTFTIGFSDGATNAAPLLIKAAEVGGGKYFAARNAVQLQSALQQVFTEILEVNASLTSPSIASNNFDRTQTLDSVYYAMFLPNKGPRWHGNLKKFRVTGSGEIVDRNGNPAIDDDGNLKNSACSYWTSTETCAGAPGGGDGNDVQLGGAAEVLRKASDRKLYGNFGDDGALNDFTVNNAAVAAGSQQGLADYMGIDKSELDEVFAWARGQDVDDDDQDANILENRQDIMGDPLHSKPLAINYGTATSPDIRILLGTNQGFLHMFRDTGDSVSESWAFMPYELLTNLPDLKANIPSGVHSIYGLDSPPVAYIKMGKSAVEKVWVFFGMRRGGKSYYGLDITNPDAPELLWQVGSDDAGLAELGQTWSEPVVTTIPGWPSGNTDPENAKPVLIIGAGYAPETKDTTALGGDDSMGRGVFVLDAQSGALVHFFGATNANTNMNGLIDSIPNSVAILDSNSDNLTDRIYATDTGGNVWRIDMPGPNPDSSETPWTAFKFAALGSNTSLPSDRRLFAEPAVAQTVFTNISQVSVSQNGQITRSLVYQNVPYDAVVVGSGMRPNPSDKSRNDMFFVLQDRHIVTRSFTGTTESPIPPPLYLSNLYDVTDSAPASDNIAENIEFGQKRGWFYDFSAEGEKSLAGALIIRGKVYFTSYVPGDTEVADSCLVAGQGRLYSFDLHRGTRTYDHEFLEVGERVPDTPQLVLPPNASGESYMYLIGIGKATNEMTPLNSIKGCADGDNRCVGGGLGVNRIYYHIDE